MRNTDFLPRLYAPLLLVYAVLCSWRPLGAGYDFWAHAAAGRWMWSNRQIPTENLFLWSAPGFPWVAHSWLSELIFFFLIEVGGPLLIVLLTLFCSVFSFCLIWRFWKSRAAINGAAALLILLGIYASLPRFQPRQELFTALILAGLLIFLVRWRDDGAEPAPEAGYLVRVALSMVALFAVWINLHALVMVALILLLGTACCDALQFGLDRRARFLLAVWLGCAAATLVNPYGLHYWQAAEQLQPGNQATYITEWKPFWYPQPLPFKFIYAEAALLAAALFAWLRNPRRRWAELFWLIVMTALMLRSRRMLWLVALVFLVVAASNSRAFDSEVLWRLYQRIMGRRQVTALTAPVRRLARGLTIAVLAFSIVLGARLTVAFTGTQWPPRIVAPETPVRIAALIRERELPGRLFNDYETSAYLHWSLNGVDPATGRVPAAGLYPLYIDLLNAFPDPVMFTYLDALGAEPQALKLFEAEKINTIYLGAHHSDGPLVRWLDGSPQWRKLASGVEGHLWVRRRPLL